MEGCIDSAMILVNNAEVGADGKRVIQDVRIATLSIGSLTEQVERVSGVAWVLSSQSLAYIGVYLQKAVARMAVAQTDADDTHQQIEAPQA